jgi:ribonuclease HI
MATYTIFCDGACPDNGKPTARAGWAFAMWNGPLESVRGEPNVWASSPLQPDTEHTNQRAELTALLVSMEHALTLPPGSSVTFYSDSKYAINCTQTWGPSWQQQGWKRSSSEPLANLELVKPMVALWTTYAVSNNWTIEHVKGHGKGTSPKVFGNNWVDKAAVKAVMYGSGTAGGSSR